MKHGMGGMCPTCGCSCHGFGHGMHGRMMGHGMMGMKIMKMKMMMMPMKMMKMVMKHSDELGVSEDQLMKLHDRFFDLLKQKVQLKSQVQIAKIDLMNMVMREDVDMNAVEQKIRDMAKLKGDMFLAWIQAMQDMKNTLTPEQRKNMKSMIKSYWKQGKGHGEESMEEEEDEDEDEEEESEEE